MSEMAHEHDDEGNCLPPEGGFYSTVPPTWRFSGWNLAGIAATGVAGLFGVVSQALNMVANECWSMARFTAQEREQREMQEAYEAHQREMAESLRGLVEGPGDQS